MIIKSKSSEMINKLVCSISNMYISTNYSFFFPFPNFHTQTTTKQPFGISDYKILVKKQVTPSQLDVVAILCPFPGSMSPFTVTQQKNAGPRKDHLNMENKHHLIISLVSNRLTYSGTFV